MSNDHQESHEGLRGVVDDDRLLRPQEAARLLGIKRSKMYGLMKDGAIEVVRISPRVARITRRALRAYIARCEQVL